MLFRSRVLRKTIALLRQGHSPDQLGLGADLLQAPSEKLLVLLHIQWCGAGTGPVNPRGQLADPAHVALGMEAVHRLAGRGTDRTGRAQRTVREVSDLTLFGRVTESTARELARGRGAATELWSVVYRNGSSFLGMLRSTGLPGAVRQIGRAHV